VFEDAAGDVVGLGRTSREPPAWMLRQVRYRDRECRFPGCGARRFAEAHHVRWWRHGGRTTLENLLLICSFHHRLVHEHGWSVKRDADGTARWIPSERQQVPLGPVSAGGGERVIPARRRPYRLWASSRDRWYSSITFCARCCGISS
jgi:HNH endonuclease